MHIYVYIIVYFDIRVRSRQKKEKDRNKLFVSFVIYCGGKPVTFGWSLERDGEREREVWIARRDQLRSCRVPWEVNQPTFLRPRRRGDSRFRSRGKFRFIQLVDTSRHHCRFYIPLSGYRGWFQWQRMMDRLRGNTYAGRRRRKEIVYPSRFPWAIKEIASWRAFEQPSSK